MYAITLDLTIFQTYIIEMEYQNKGLNIVAKIHSFTNNPGFYTLIHRPTGHFYFGSTKGISGRMSTHASTVRNGTHFNAMVLKHFADWDDVKILVTYFDDLADARRWEQWYLNKYHGHPLCCNQVKDPLKPLDGKEVKLTKGSARTMDIVRMSKTPEAIAKHATNISKPVYVDGFVFPSLTIAAKALGKSLSTVNWGLRTASGRYADWRHI